MRLINAENKALSTIQSDNVIKLYAHSKDSKYIYQILQYGDLGSLTDYLDKTLKSSRPNLAQQFEWLLFFEKIAKALQDIHDSGFLHLDMKTDNIVLAKGTGNLPEPLIIDFGFSKSRTEKEKIGENKYTYEDKTLQYSLFGTPLYLSPEIVNSVSSYYYTPKVDVYALGVILFSIMQRDENPFKLTRNPLNRVKPFSIKGPIIKEIALIIEGSLHFYPDKRMALSAILK